MAFKQWCAQKSNQFVESLDKESISKIDSKLSLMLQNKAIEQNDIDEVVQKIGKIFERSAETSFGYVKLIPKKQS